MRRQPGPSRSRVGAATPVPGATAARTATAQTVPMTLDWQLADAILTLTATTPRRGESCDDRWSMSPSVALTSATVADASRPCGASYVSRAWVAGSSLARDTTYTFGYSIVMSTSEFTCVGSGSVSITVGPDGSLTSPMAAPTPL